MHVGATRGEVPVGIAKSTHSMREGGFFVAWLCNFALALAGVTGGHTGFSLGVSASDIRQTCGIADFLRVVF